MRFRDLLNEIALDDFSMSSATMNGLKKQDFSKTRMAAPDDDVDDLGAKIIPDLPKGFYLVGRMGDWFVALRKDVNTNVYTWLDGGSIVGYVSVGKPKDGSTYDFLDYVKAFQIKAIHVTEEYLGRGVALSMYEWLLHNACDVIVADSRQTEDGAKLWLKMNRDSRFVVRVYDLLNWRSETVTNSEFLTVYEDDDLIPFATIPEKEANLGIF